MAENKSSKIGVATATIIGMNAMIGSGIFSAPAAMAANVGPAGILAYIFVVFSVWFIALSLARLAALFPQEGSFYTYTKQWAGHIGGMFAGCAYFFGLLIAMGLLAQMAGSYLHHFFPLISSQTLGLLTLAILVVLNMFGVVFSEIGQQILICTTLFPLVTITIICLTKANLANLTPFAPFGLGNVLHATRVVIFGFFGFECAASLFNVVKNPERNVPRALTYSIAIVGTVYTLFVSALILSVPLDYFLDPRVPLTHTLAIIFPNNNWLLGTIHCAILSAIIGTIHSMIWSSSELFVSLTKKIHTSCIQRFTLLPQLTQQRIAVGLVGFSIMLSCLLLKNMNLFFSLTATGIVTAYILSMITLLTLKSEWQSGQNIKTILGIITALMMLYFAIEGVVLEVASLFV
jgi:APA family basic amino acid/polyamine antiporter